MYKRVMILSLSVVSPVIQLHISDSFFLKIEGDTKFRLYQNYVVVVFFKLASFPKKLAITIISFALWVTFLMFFYLTLIKFKLYSIYADK